jgi:hypothetical protein
MTDHALDEHGVPLAEAIAELRTELQKAMDDGKARRCGSRPNPSSWSWNSR